MFLSFFLNGRMKSHSPSFKIFIEFFNCSLETYSYKAAVAEQHTILGRLCAVVIYVHISKYLNTVRKTETEREIEDIGMYRSLSCNEIQWRDISILYAFSSYYYCIKIFSLYKYIYIYIYCLINKYNLPLN